MARSETEDTRRLLSLVVLIALYAVAVISLNLPESLWLLVLLGIPLGMVARRPWVLALALIIAAEAGSYPDSDDVPTWFLALFYSGAAAAGIAVGLVLGNVVSGRNIRSSK